MKQLCIDRNAVSAIVITHFHADHFGGIPFFILDAQFFSKRREPLTIVGPVGLAECYERVMETAFPGSSKATQKFALQLVEVPAGGSAEIENATVHAYQAIHGPADGPYLSVRIETEGRAVAYTGDTEWTPGLILASREADLFIAEAYFWDKEVATHLSLHTIEENLDRLSPKRLILTHMSDDMLDHPDRDKYECAVDGMVVAIA